VNAAAYLLLPKEKPEPARTSQAQANIQHYTW